MIARAPESAADLASAVRYLYRLHLEQSDCWLCLTGRDCLTRDRLDREANVADFAAERGIALHERDDLSVRARAARMVVGVPTSRQQGAVLRGDVAR